MLTARNALLEMKAYHPPLRGRTGLRLDFNENLAGCSPRSLRALRAMNTDAVAAYPERDGVEAVTAEFLGLRHEQVLLTNGVDEAIHLVCEAYLEAGAEALIATPTFGMYEIYARQTGANVVQVQAGADLAFPVARFLAAITPRTRLVLIANPNNPTGQALAIADLERILLAAPDAAVLVDEAYFEFHGETMMPRLSDFPNLFVARTFSKAYGMAGLRVGALCGAAEQLGTLRKIVSAYNVNSAALACLPEALADAVFVADYVAEVVAGRERFCRELSGWGVVHWPSRGNFVLCRLADAPGELAGSSSGALVLALRQKGILIRDRNRDPGCAGCVRITIGTREQMNRLLVAMSSALAI